jgi:hypothetical protein
MSAHHDEWGVVVRPLVESTGYLYLTSSKNLIDSQTPCIVAATSSSLHIYGLEILNSEGNLVQICTQPIFGRIAAVGVISTEQSERDHILVLLRDGRLGLLHHYAGR